MGDKTGIEWTDATWNPVTGCTKVSPGCDHCYAERVTERFSGPGSFTRVLLHPERLDMPTRWRRPRRIFVNSMSDLFHDEVPDEFIAVVFAVMATCAAHTFQVLTKRHGRMRSLLSSDDFWRAVHEHQADWMRAGPSREQNYFGARPLPNVWLGVSVEDQKWADIRVPALLATPAAVRFLSCEPLLGPIDLTNGSEFLRCGNDVFGHECHGCTIDWVIAGGESGPGARPMHLDWARSLRDQCSAAGVPFLFKQWGEWRPTNIGVGVLLGRQQYGEPVDDGIHSHLPWRRIYERVGKKTAGRELDGRTWDEYPQRILVS